MRLRSDAEAELAEVTCDEASDSEIDTPVAGRPRKRRKASSKPTSEMRNRTQSLSEIAHKFGNVNLENDYKTIMRDSQLGPAKFFNPKTGTFADNSIHQPSTTYSSPINVPKRSGKQPSR